MPGVFNLDEYQRPDDEVSRVEPFKIVLGGKEIILVDPQTIDWKISLTADSPVDLLRAAAGGDWDALVRADMPGWKFRKLLMLYMEHYKVPDQARQAMLSGINTPSTSGRGA